MEDADYFRQKAEQCRRLAGAVPNQKAMAVEFEAKAVALAAAAIVASARTIRMAPCGVGRPAGYCARPPCREQVPGAFGCSLKLQVPSRHWAVAPGGCV